VTSSRNRLTSLGRAELAALVPEYLLAGHLIDRAGMPHLIAAFGVDTMRQVAIEEWMGASPVYTKRMQRALNFEGDTVETIFKGMQLDIGAPPQFMDFRYQVDSDRRGEFWLDHCGALMDVEPMGEEFVVAMCHDIEDPTFDATAIATNPRAQVRPVHRPPRTPPDRSPHCHWTVVIADDHDPLPTPAEAVAIAETEAASLELAAIDPDDDGLGDYGGPLLDDLRFGDWSHSALVRTADEVCLQGHLLALSFRQAVRRRDGAEGDANDGDERAAALTRQQFTGVAGIAARRLKQALGLGDDLDAAAALLRLHPAFLPAAYVDLDVALSDRLVVTIGRDDPAHRDGAWPSLLRPGRLAPLDAIVREVDPRFRADVIDDRDDALTVEIVMDDAPAPVASEVELTAFSTGTGFAFADRGVPVAIGSAPR
jgi:hypothetical protein